MASILLLPAPELPTHVAERIAGELPKLLSERVDNEVSWEVSVVSDPLTAEHQSEELIRAARERGNGEDYDLIVCLTDLPLRSEKRPIVADASAQERVALISVPALGPTGVRARVCDAIVGLAHELRGSSEAVERLVRPRAGEWLAPIRRVSPSDGAIDVRFVSPVAVGHLRLLAGMVRANRPWRLIPGLAGAVAAACATGAYVLVTSSLWQVAESLGWVRLVIFCGGAIAAMVAWIIVSQHLWERPAEGMPQKEAALYNAATALTIAFGVLAAYLGLFIFILLGSTVVVDGTLFDQNVGHPMTFSARVELAWFAASLATVAGALGSGLDSEDDVRKAAYGYRQRLRGEAAERG